MDMLVVQGGRPLHGVVHVDGAKNAALPIMAAALAVDGRVRLQRVPDLVDVRTMALLLQSLGVHVDRATTNEALIDATEATGWVADYELVRQMRASICVLGPLLARFGRARVSLPGGCNIGHRPVDLHLKGLTALGANVKIAGGYIVAECHQLQGAEFTLGGSHGSTVTGTCNLLVAASLAQGRTVIRDAAREPEVADLGRFLISAGAKIDGLGTSVLEIDGVERLQTTNHSVIPDRIEAATFAIAAAATGGDITIPNAPAQEMQSVTDLLRAIGVQVRTDGVGLNIAGSAGYNPADIIAEPFPGIPTDCQAQFMALLATVDGRSTVRDTVFPDRFMHASELMRMGAQIRRKDGLAVIDGGRTLTGADVMASDLRASAALVIAALAAEGQTTMRRIYHLDRGYAGLEQKLKRLGADVERVSVGRPSRPHFLSTAKGQLSASDESHAGRKSFERPAD